MYAEIAETDEHETPERMMSSLIYPPPPPPPIRTTDCLYSWARAFQLPSPGIKPCFVRFEKYVKDVSVSTGNCSKLYMKTRLTDV